MTFLFSISPFIPLLIGIIKGSFRLSYLTPFGIFLLYSFLNEVLMNILADYGIHNAWALNFWLIFQYCFLSIFFIKFYFIHFKWNWFIISNLPVCILFFLKIDNLNEINLPLQSLVHITIGIVSCIFLIQVMSRAKVNPVKLPQFWICTGLAIFFFGAHLIFSLASLFKVNTQRWLSDIYLILVLLLIALSNILYSIGILCSSKNSTSRFS